MATYNNVITNVSGSVGIGTTNATSRLLVLGNSSLLSEPIATFKANGSQTGGAGVLDVQNSSGTSILFVTGSGYVGIGSTQPSSRLVVEQNLNGDLDILVNNSYGGGNERSRIAFQNYPSVGALPAYIAWSVNTYTMAYVAGRNNFGFHDFRTINGGSEQTRMIISNAGNVGVGSGNNITAKLLVSGSGASTGATAHFVNSSGNSLLFVRDDGLVGVGTNIPSTKLHVYNGGIRITGDLSTTVVPIFELQSIRYDTNDRDYQLLGSGVNTDELFFNAYLKDRTTRSTYSYNFNSTAGSVPTLRIDNNGRVGVGTGTNTNLLTVNQASNTTTAMSTTYGIMVSNQGTTSISIGNDGTNSLIQSWSSNPLLINGQGNHIFLGGAAGGPDTAVGFGGAPLARLHVQGSTTTTRPTLLVREQQAMANATATLDVRNSSNASLLFVSGSGNVGIGTATPGYLFDVNGSFRTQGSKKVFYVGNFPPNYSGYSYDRIIQLDTSFTPSAGGTDVRINNNIYQTGRWTVEVTFTGDLNGTGVGVSYLLMTFDTTVNNGGSGYNAINPRLYVNDAQAGSYYGSISGQIALSTSNQDLILTIAGSSTFSTGLVSIKFVGSQINGVTPTMNLTLPGTTTSTSWINQNGWVTPVGSSNLISAYTANTERLRIDSSGNVGIGTTNANSNRLAVSGQTSITGSVLPGDNGVNYDLGSASYKWRTLYAVNISGSLTPTGATAGSVFFAGTAGQIQQDNANFFWDDANNKLGIRTNSPGQSLSVLGDFAVSTSGTGPVAYFAHANTTTNVNLVSDGIIRITNTSSTAGNISPIDFFNASANVVARISAINENQTTHAGSLAFVTRQDASTYGERLRIAAGGNVGIGTNNPSTKLHLWEPSASDAIFRITPGNTPTEYDGLIQITGQTNDITLEGFEIWYKNSTGDVRIATTYNSDQAAIRFHTRTASSKSTSNERLTIYGNGNVGIGSVTPTAKLFVQGSTTTTTPTLVVKENQAMANATAAFEVQNSTGSSLLFVSGSGNVGIGTNTPNNRVTIVSAGANVGGNFNYIMNVVDSQGSSYKGLLLGYDASSNTGILAASTVSAANNLAFWTYNGLAWGERIRIDTAGNIGVGTATISTRFQVQGSSTAATPTMLVKEGVASPTGGVRTFEVQKSTGASIFSVSGSGYVGVGTSNPAGTFEVVGVSGSLLLVTDTLSGSLFSVNDITGLSILEVFSDDTVIAGAANSNALVVTGSRVGIGTSNPSEKLQLIGGNLYLSGTAGGGVSAVDYNNSTFSRLIFNNDYSSTAKGPNKITLYDSGWLGGFGIHGGTVGYYSGGSHAWYQATSAANVTLRLTVDGSGNTIPGTDNAQDLGSLSYRWKNLYAVNVSGAYLTGSNLSAGQVVYAGTGGVLNGNNNLYWDNSNARLGVSTNAPDQSIDVRGNIGMSRRAQAAVTRYIGLTNTDGTFSSTAGQGTTGLIIDQHSGGDTSLRFKTGYWGSSEDIRMMIDRAGNVGIGTTVTTNVSFSYKLQVNGTAMVWDGTNGRISMVPSGGASPGYVEWRNGSGNRLGYMGGASSSNLNISLENSANFYIDGGNVGIGTATVAARLHVLGSSTITTPTLLVKEQQVMATATALADFQNSSGTSLMFLSGSGWFGLGTNSPSQKMHISNNGSVYTQWQDTSGGGLIGYVGASVSSGVFDISSPSPIRFWVNNAERARINTSGDVGIGTATYTGRLYVSGSSTSSTSVIVGRAGIPAPSGALLDLQNNEGTTAFLVNYQGSVRAGTSGAGMVLDFRTNGSNRLDLLFSDGASWYVNPDRSTGSFINFFENTLGGQVYIGNRNADAVNTLRNGNPLYLSTRYWNGSASVAVNPSIQALIDSTSPDYRLNLTAGSGNINIRSNGSVGIGTTSPTYTLDVSGPISMHDEAQDLDSRYYGGTFLRGWSSFNAGTEANITYTTDTSCPVGTEVISVSTYVWPRGPKIRLDKTQNYEVEIWAKRQTANTAGTFYFVVSNYDSSGNVINGDGADWHYPINVNPLPATWTKYRFVVGPYGGSKDHSSTARYISVGFIANYTAGTDVIYLSGFKCRPIPRYNNDALTIYNDGSVGIGLTNPSSKLHVSAGDIRIDSNSYGIVYTSGASTNNVLKHNGTRFIPGQVAYSELSGAPTVNGTTNYVARFTPNGTSLGTGVLYDNGTNVGVNTPSPLARLHINGSSASAPCLVLPDVTNPRYSVGFGNVNVGGVGQRLDFYAGDSGNNSSNLDGTSLRMSLTATGKVGIGTTDPLELLNLGSNSSLFIQGNSNSWGYKINVNDYGGGDVPIRFIRRNSGADTESMRIDQSGRVGIGVTNIPTRLTVLSNNTQGTADTTWVYNANGDYRNSISNEFFGGSAASNKMFLRVSDGTTTAQSTIMTLIGTARVGIGTTDPTSKLQVWTTTDFDGLQIDGINGAATFRSWLRLFPSGSAGAYNPLVGQGDSAIIFSRNSTDTGNLVIAPWTNSSNGIKIDNTGNVGIGTSSMTKKLVVNASDALINSVLVGRGGTGAGADNTALGQSASNSLTTGGANTSVGNAANFYNNASNNTAIGYSSQYTNTNGISNTSLGVQSLYTNSGLAGQNNVAIGMNALYFSTGYGDNTAVGYESIKNGSRAGRTAVGFRSLYNGGPSYSTAVGYNAMYNAGTSATNCVAVGAYALETNTTGTDNTAIGISAMTKCTGFSRNTAVGAEAIGSGPNSYENTAVGYRALLIGDGQGNVAVGAYALDDKTTSFNTAVGWSALGNTGGGGDNTAIGYSAGSSISAGSRNLVLGYSSGTGLTDGNYNVVLGSYQAGTPFATQSNNIFISDGQANLRMLITGSNGGVGIGTTSWNGLISVLGDTPRFVSSTVSNANYTVLQAENQGCSLLVMGKNPSVSTPITASFGTYSDGASSIPRLLLWSTRDIAFATSWNTPSVSAVIFDLTGSVGIGTEVPRAKLDVNGKTRLRDDVGIDAGKYLYLGREESFGGSDTGGSDYGYLRWDNDNNDYDFWSGGSAENGALIIGSENDSNNGNSDVVVLKGKAANIFDSYSGLNLFVGPDGGNSSSGNTVKVGIGTTNPTATLSVMCGATQARINQVYTDYAGIFLNGSTTDDHYNFLSNASGSDKNLYINRPDGWDIRFRKGNGDQVTITSAGYLGVGTTGPVDTLDVRGGFQSEAIYPRVNNVYNIGYYNIFIGYMAYNTIYGYYYPNLSDYRTKKNIQEVKGSLEKISKLRPITYEYNGTVGGTENLGTRIGFLAHEVQEQFPLLVTGEKDDVDEESGKIKLQMIMQDDLIPYAVDAIRELKSENDSLKSEIQSLKDQISSILALLNNK